MSGNPGPVTFQQARDTVDRALRTGWEPDAGTFMVAEYGWQDADAWQVVAGAREALVDGDAAYTRMDAPAYLVSKATGELSMVPLLEVLGRLQAMDPVGDPPE